MSMGTTEKLKQAKDKGGMGAEVEVDSQFQGTFNLQIFITLSLPLNN